MRSEQTCRRIAIEQPGIPFVVAGRALVTRRERPISMKSGTTERP